MDRELMYPQLTPEELKIPHDELMLKLHLRQHIEEWDTLIEATKLARKEEGRIGHDFPAEGFEVKGEWGEKYQSIRNTACHPYYILTEAIAKMEAIRGELAELEMRIGKATNGS